MVNRLDVRLTIACAIARLHHCHNHDKARLELAQISVCVHWSEYQLNILLAHALAVGSVIGHC